MLVFIGIVAWLCAFAVMLITEDWKERLQGFAVVAVIALCLIVAGLA
jgi:NADH:ubiquinone oxidoreductase subunit 6 (subunit J)